MYIPSFFKGSHKIILGLTEMVVILADMKIKYNRLVQCTTCTFADKNYVVHNLIGCLKVKMHPKPHKNYMYILHILHVHSETGLHFAASSPSLSPPSFAACDGTNKNDVQKIV